jgi:hypothetical protein
MCSCSGNCNCNSTTIPRGPQGQTGATGAQGPRGFQGLQGFPGIPGENGTNGTNGINAYSTLTVGFTQPSDNVSRNIAVQNNTWMAPGQIIYIGPGDTSTDPGGYYKVNFLLGGSSTQLNVMKLDWTDPNTTFVVPTGLVDQGARVTSAGVIGPDGLIRKVLDETSDSAITFTTGSSTAELDWLYDGLITNQDTLNFEFEVEPNSGNGRFNFITFSVGSTVVSSFTFSGAGGAAALVAARINFSTAPSAPVPGYVSSLDEAISEDINFIRGFVRITRSTSTGVDVKVEYLMCNKYVQRSYGSSQETFQVQKHFIGTKRISGVPNLDSNSLLIEISAVPESMNLGTYGAEITIKNAIKLSSIL